MGAHASPRDSMILAIGADAAPLDGRGRTSLAGPTGDGGVADRRRSKSGNGVVRSGGGGRRSDGSSSERDSSPDVHSPRRRGSPSFRQQQSALPPIAAGGEWSSTCTSASSSQVALHTQTPPRQHHPAPPPPKHTVPVPPAVPSVAGSSPPISRSARLAAKSDAAVDPSSFRPQPNSSRDVSFDRKPIRRAAVVTHVVTAAEAFSEAGATHAYAAACSLRRQPTLRRPSTVPAPVDTRLKTTCPRSRFPAAAASAAAHAPLPHPSNVRRRRRRGSSFDETSTSPSALRAAAIFGGDARTSSRHKRHSIDGSFVRDESSDDDAASRSGDDGGGMPHACFGARWFFRL